MVKIKKFNNKLNLALGITGAIFAVGGTVAAVIESKKRFKKQAKRGNDISKIRKTITALNDYKVTIALSTIGFGLSIFTSVNGYKAIVGLTGIIAMYESQIKEYEEALKKVKKASSKDPKIEKIMKKLHDEKWKDLRTVFNDESYFYTEDYDSNLLALHGVESVLNNSLQRHGFLLLNDYYDHLGLPRTNEGRFLGWTDGDDIQIIDYEYMQDHKTELPDDIILNPNVSGIVEI